MTTLEIIDEQEKDFNKEWEKANSWSGGNFGSLDEDGDIEDPIAIARYSQDGIFNWHKQSIIQILEAEVERKRGMLVECDMCDNREIHDTGENKIHFEDITHFTNIINKLK